MDLAFVGDYTLAPNGVAFDGLTGRAMTTGQSPLDATKSFTLSAWVTYVDQVTDLSWAISLTAANQTKAAVGVAGPAWYLGTTSTDLSGEAAAFSNDWVHLVAVFDREAGIDRLFVNGKLLGESADATPAAAGGPLFIGGGPEGSGWAGAIADVAVYQSALTSDGVSAIYETTRPTSAAPPWSPDPSTYAGGVLNGTWEYVVDDGADTRLIALLRSDHGGTFGQAVLRLGFDGPRWWLGEVFDGELLMNEEGLPEGDHGLISAQDGRAPRLAMIGNGGQTRLTYEWGLSGKLRDQLVLHLIEQCDISGGQPKCTTDRSQFDRDVLDVTEHTYTKTGDDGSTP